MEFRIDHFGVAVADLDQSLAQYAALFGYRLVRGPFDDPHQQARVAFISCASDQDPLLELVAPLSPGSQVERLLAKGVSLYHVCYETPDIEAAIAYLRGQGCLLISGPTPAVAYDSRPIAWLYTPSRQLTELVEAPRQESASGSPQDAEGAP
jgi:methylmalonyl-CoA/ethylmalonyl-CoA epimerase